MRFILNPLYGNGLPSVEGMASGEISTDTTAARALFAKCPIAHVTPIIELPGLADDLGLKNIYIKDERGRMGLGSFKALGAAYAIAKAAARKTETGSASSMETALKGTTYVCASAGNHGLSMVAGARQFGADAVVYLSETVPESFADRLRAKSGRVVREGDTYEASMAAAVQAAGENSWELLSDSSWAGYSEPARDVMEGYLIMGAEVVEQMDMPPTHIFLQAGVGGLAAACTAAARMAWGYEPVICIVEPDAAPALMNSIIAGEVVTSDGPVSNMGRLDCKEPSHLALKYLAKEANAFMVVSDDEATEAVSILKQAGISSSPSGVAGLAGLRYACTSKTDLNPGLGPLSRVLLYVSEGPVTGD